MTELLENLAEIHDSLDDAFHALNSFQFMLGKTLEGSSLRGDICYGMTRLLEMQVQELGGIKDALEIEFTSLGHLGGALIANTAAEFDPQAGTMSPQERIAEIMRGEVLKDADRPAWHDLDTIAARSRVHKSEVARVMFVLTGEDHEGPAYRAWDGNLSEGLHSHLLSSLCYEALARGDMWGQISTATELPLEKVKQVLQAMLTYTPIRKEIELYPIAQDLLNRETAQQGPDLGQIARDTDLEEETVRRVVDRLQADPRTATIQEPEAKAVNN